MQPAVQLTALSATLATGAAKAAGVVQETIPVLLALLFFFMLFFFAFAVGQAKLRDATMSAERRALKALDHELNETHRGALKAMTVGFRTIGTGIWELVKLK